MVVGVACVVVAKLFWDWDSQFPRSFWMLCLAEEDECCHHAYKESVMFYFIKIVLISVLLMVSTLPAILSTGIGR